ncbi:DNA-binding protein WhiA [Mycoplasmatota bacterium]|nr:DNA-binding protein WhiA [Mycoplasmatota bacterium]
MSFAADVKKELTKVLGDNCCQLAELSALLRSNGEIFISSNGMKIDYHTQNPTIAKRVVILLKSVYQSDIELITKKQRRLNRRNLYIVRIINNIDLIIRELELMEGLTPVNNIPLELIKSDCCKRAYLRGVFISCGSINNPRTSLYHLELLIKSETHAKEVLYLINSFHYNAKMITRNKGYMIYLKEAEKISDFLKLIEAYGSVMFYEDIRIYRDINNSINRMNNCDIANQKRVISTAKKQIDDIDYIESTIGLENLTEKLREAAILRKENPEASLNELLEIGAEVIGKDITKSGLNHRFRKIKEIAEDIRGN